MPTLLHKAADAVLKKIHRNPLYYLRYNNTMSYKVNRTYVRYAQECMDQYAKAYPTDSARNPLATEPAYCLRQAFTPEKAKALSDKMSELIEANSGFVSRNPNIKKKQVIIKYPLESLGDAFLDVLKNPDVDKAVTGFFRSHYAITSIMALRSLPAGEVVGSWLWHSDCFPPFTCKMFIHLTPANDELGATEFMSIADTNAYRKAGYFGLGGERIENLEAWAKDRGLPYRPFHIDANPGDATLFNMNYFHRAITPKRDFRDVIELFFIPSAIPWQEHLAKHMDYVKDPPYGFPKDPNRLVAASPSASAGAGGMM